MELIKLDSKEANERIGKKGFFRWQEENRKPGDILMEGSNNLAYGLMMYLKYSQVSRLKWAFIS